MDKIFFHDKHISLNPKFFVQSIGEASGQIPIEIKATNGFNTTDLKFGVTVKEIVEKLTIKRVGVFTYQEGKVYEFEKTTATASSTRILTNRMLDETTGAEISGPIYTMTVAGATRTNGVKLANVWGRGDLLGQLVCKGGLVENGESVKAANPADLGDVSKDDTIVDS
jgi:hypothetical protein